MDAGSVEERVSYEWQMTGAKELVAGTDEDNKQGELKRVDEVSCDLRGDQVEAEEEGKRKTCDGARAKQRVDANDDAGGE